MTPSKTAMSALHRLFYISRADEDFSHRDLADMLLVARNHNATHGITGVLIFDGLHPSQLLEGSAQELLPLKSRMYADTRQTEVNLLFFEPIAGRRYRSWALGYLSGTALVDEMADRIARKVLDPASAKQLADRLMMFVDQAA